MNAELDRRELRQEIETLLYLAIRNEFNLRLDPKRMEGWLCSRIAWRALDHISRECDLIYGRDDDSGEAQYRRVEKISLDQTPQATANLKRTNTVTAKGVATYDTSVSFGDMIPASIERHPTFESFLRKSRIKTQHKHVLMYVIAMNYNFRELADVYGVSSPTARKLYKRAVESLRRYIMKLSVPEQTSVHNLLKGVYERQ
jgi:DNA-directed RNA polymerase specialized sigma24 family protein